MEKFLDKFCYIIIDSNGNRMYYLNAKVTSITDTHISFNDTFKDGEPHTYRIADVVEIKLSNRGGYNE